MEMLCGCIAAASLLLVTQQQGWNLEEMLGLRVQRSVGHLDSRDVIILASSVSQASLILGRFKLTCLVFGVYSSPHV